MADGEHGVESGCCNSGRLLGVSAVASRRSQLVIHDFPSKGEDVGLVL